MKIMRLNKVFAFRFCFLLALLGSWWLAHTLVLGADLILPAQLQDFATLSLSVIIEALPFVILGIVISIVVRVWLSRDILFRHLPQSSGLRRLTLSLLGIFLPVCECGNVPLARGLIMRGLSPAEALTFLLAVPILNPITIITTLQAFPADTSIVVFRVAGGLMIANLIGWIYATSKPAEMLKPDFVASCRHQHRPKTARAKWLEALDIFRLEARAMLPALLIGALLAAAVQTAVPREILLTLGSNPAWSILAMLLLAFVVSICSSVDAFFALAFRDTFTVGALVSFLTFGPMIDIKMLSLLRTTFRARILWQVSAVVALLSALIGSVVNYAF